MFVSCAATGTPVSQPSSEPPPTPPPQVHAPTDPDDEIIALYDAAGLPNIVGGTFVHRIDGPELCDVGFEIQDGQRRWFLGSTLTERFDGQLADQIPARFRRSGFSGPIEFGATEGPEHSGEFFREPELHRVAVQSLRGRGLILTAASCSVPFARRRVRDIVLAAWSRQLGLPARELPEAPVDTYRAALCEALLEEFERGLTIWRPREDLVRLLGGATRVCRDPFQVARIPPHENLQPSGALEESFAEWTPQIPEPERSRTQRLRLADPRTRALAQGDAGIPALIALADSSVRGRAGMTVGALVRTVLSRHAYREIEDQADAQRWWDTAKNLDRRGRIVLAADHPAFDAKRAGEHVVDIDGWSAVEWDGPPTFAIAAAQRLVVGDPGTLAERRRAAAWLDERTKGIGWRDREEDIELLLALDAREGIDRLLAEGMPHDHEMAEALLEAIAQEDHEKGWQWLREDLEGGAHLLRRLRGDYGGLCLRTACPREVREAALVHIADELSAEDPPDWSTGIARSAWAMLGREPELAGDGAPILLQRRRLAAALGERGLPGPQVPPTSPKTRTATLASHRVWATGLDEDVPAAVETFLSERNGARIDDPAEFALALAGVSKGRAAVIITRERGRGTHVDVCFGLYEIETFASNGSEVFDREYGESLTALLRRAGFERGKGQAGRWLELVFEPRVP